MKKLILFTLFIISNNVLAAGADEEDTGIYTSRHLVSERGDTATIVHKEDGPKIAILGDPNPIDIDISKLEKVELDRVSERFRSTIQEVLNFINRNKDAVPLSVQRRLVDNGTSYLFDAIINISKPYGTLYLLDK